MARKVIEQIISDLSGDEMAPGKGETVEFSYRGSSYSIDLTDQEAKGFDKAVAMYIEHGSKVPSSRRSTSRSSSAGTSRSGSGRTAEETAAIREWGSANGHKVSERGRLSAELVAAYESAH